MKRTVFNCGAISKASNASELKSPRQSIARDRKSGIQAFDLLMIFIIVGRKEISTCFHRLLWSTSIWRICSTTRIPGRESTNPEAIEKLMGAFPDRMSHISVISIWNVFCEGKLKFDHSPRVRRAICRQRRHICERSNCVLLLVKLLFCHCSGKHHVNMCSKSSTGMRRTGERISLWSFRYWVNVWRLRWSSFMLDCSLNISLSISSSGYCSSDNVFRMTDTSVSEGMLFVPRRFGVGDGPHVQSDSVDVTHRIWFLSTDGVFDDSPEKLRIL